MQSSKDIILYSYAKSSPSWRLRIALNMKNIAYTYRAVNPDKDSKDEEYLRINPQGQNPALYIDGSFLTQTLPMCEYLEETRPEILLLPKDPIMRAKVRTICEIINSGIQPYHNPSFSARLEENSVDKIELAAFYISNGFKALEKIISETRGKYCVGDEVTLADAYFVPEFASTGRFNVDITPFKNLIEINNALSLLEGFKKSIPQAQPDYE